MRPDNKRLSWNFAREHPILTFLFANFAWTWLFWLAAIPFQGRNDLLVIALVMIGGFGPAVGGIATLGLKKGVTFRLSQKRAAVMALAAILLFVVMALRYSVGNVPQFQILAKDLTLSLPIIGAVVVACLVGGWAISSAVSSNPDVRARMASILPRQMPPFWTVLALVIFPLMVLASWGLASLAGMDVEFPGLWGQPVLEVLPIYALTFLLTGLAQGGMEEPGWRGTMQPALQKRFSPLVAALIVAVFWSLWHLPLYLNGFYPEELVGGMVGGFIYRILLSIFLAWFYNRSGGNLLLMIYLHTCFNMVVNFLPTSDLGLLMLWVLVVVFIVLKDKMYRKVPSGMPDDIAIS
jgi:membrane protease YdiL (CAAX protease family)